jgi:hypothetical protein
MLLVNKSFSKVAQNEMFKARLQSPFVNANRYNNEPEWGTVTLLVTREWFQSCKHKKERRDESNDEL